MTSKKKATKMKDLKTKKNPKGGSVPSSGGGLKAAKINDTTIER